MGSVPPLRSELAIGSRSRPAHAFFDMNSAQPPCSPESLPVAFARSDVFKSAVAPVGLMIGNFSDLGG